MKIKKTTALLFSLAAVAFLAGRATSSPQDTEASAQEAGAGMMGPGKMHRLLDPLEGSFKADMKFWRPGSEEPQTMTGEMKRSWILNGFFLEENFTGEFAGQPFKGRGYIGWSSAEEAYQTLWFDSMSGIILFKTGGQLSDDGKSIISMGMQRDDMTGEEFKSKNVMTIEGQDKSTFAAYRMGDDGTETKTMEIVYTRK